MTGRREGGYALGINDPWTPSLVRRAEAGEISGAEYSLRGSGEQEVKDFSVEYDEGESFSELRLREATEEGRYKVASEFQLDQEIDQKLDALTDLNLSSWE